MAANMDSMDRGRARDAVAGEIGGGAGAPALFASDWALDYLRRQLPLVLPLYVVAMTPFSAALLLVFDAITSRDRRALFPRCVLLAVTCLWRWAVLARLQQRVLTSLRGPTAARFRRRVAGIVFVRLVAAVVLGWGLIFLAIPSFFALFVGGCIAPLAMDDPDYMWPLTRRLITYVSAGSSALLRMVLSFMLVALVVVIALESAQRLAVDIVLPGFLAINTAGVAFTLGSAAWQLCLFYFFFLLFDLWWTVACVMVVENLRARRTGSDMRLRLHQLKGAA